jgi:ribosomal protein S18 acetylase RimI-like enzyme
MKVVEPRTVQDFELYFDLRFHVLRKPWNRPPGSEKDELEEGSLHAMLLDDQNEVAGVCRMQYNGPDEAQLRYMAIRADLQGKGFGKLLLDHFEIIARKQKLKYITLQARENAVSFYKRNGYEVKEKTMLLWDTIQHYRMEKQL